MDANTALILGPFIAQFQKLQKSNFYSSGQAASTNIVNTASEKVDTNVNQAPSQAIGQENQQAAPQMQFSTQHMSIMQQQRMQIKKKALQRREQQDPRYGYLTINTTDFKVDQKLKMRRMKQFSLYERPNAGNAGQNAHQNQMLNMSGQNLDDAMQSDLNPNQHEERKVLNENDGYRTNAGNSHRHNRQSNTLGTRSRSAGRTLTTGATAHKRNQRRLQKAARKEFLANGLMDKEKENDEKQLKSLGVKQRRARPAGSGAGHSRGRSSGRTGQAVQPRVFKCHLESCGKIFQDRASLKKHMTVHGDKLFQCTFFGCNKRFLDNAKLKRHMLVHTGEKPYQCDICGKKFSLDFNLKTHLRIHTGEKPFSCPYPNCNKRFNQKSNLHAHQQTHHMDDPSNQHHHQDSASFRQFLVYKATSQSNLPGQQTQLNQSGGQVAPTGSVSARFQLGQANENGQPTNINMSQQQMMFSEGKPLDYYLNGPGISNGDPVSTNTTKPAAQSSAQAANNNDNEKEVEDQDDSQSNKKDQNNNNSQLLQQQQQSSEVTVFFDGMLTRNQSQPQNLQQLKNKLINRPQPVFKIAYKPRQGSKVVSQFIQNRMQVCHNLYKQVPGSKNSSSGLTEHVNQGWAIGPSGEEASSVGLPPMAERRESIGEDGRVQSVSNQVAMDVLNDMVQKAILKEEEEQKALDLD